MQLDASWNGARRSIGLVLCVAIALPQAALAGGGVVRDGSIGDAGVVSGGIDALGVEATYLIDADDGERSGGSVFHSFDTFSVDTGETATFDGAPDAGIHHVVSRVTGGSRSDIDGTIRSTIPGAAVWLLNPAGVLFGENAEVDVPGAFHAGAAGELEYSDGSRFRAERTAPVPALLEVASPVRFGFLGPGEIVADGAHLRVADGAELGLVGNEVHVERGSFLEAASGTLRIQGDRIVIEGGLSVAGESGGSIDVAGEDVKIRTTAVLDADYENDAVDRARVHIEGAQSVRIDGLVTASALDSDAYGEKSGEITVSGGKIEIGPAGVLTASSDGVARGGDVVLDGERVRVDGEVLAESRFDAGGRVEIVAEGAVNVGEHGRVSAASTGLFAGKGGEVRIEAERIDVAGQVTAASSRDDGGRVELVANDEILLRSRALVSVAGGEPGSGDADPIDPEAEGGAVRLEAASVETARGSLISARGSTPENPGTIEVFADQQQLEGSTDPMVCPGACPAEDPAPGAEGPPGPPVAGRIVLDGSLGPAREIAGPDYVIPEADGQRGGANLFHSFDTFSVGTDERATFTGSAEIHHIVARVTGGSASEVDGLVCTDIPGASLWLLNPDGWLFGANARFDVAGGIHVGAAEGLEFGAGRFDLTTPVSAVATLSGDPVGWTLGEGSGDVAVHGAALRAGSGDVGSTLELVAADDVVVTEGSVLDVSSVRTTGGTVVIEAGDEVEVDGHLRANSRYEDAGAIEIAGGGDVRIGATGIVQADAETLGISGRVAIEGEDVTVAGVVSSTSRFDDGRNSDYFELAIAIEAADSLTITEGGSLRADSESAGNAGEIQVVGAEVVIDGSVSASSVLDDGGEIAVESEGSVGIGSLGSIRADSSGGFEEGGEVAIEAEDVAIGGLVSASGKREGGEVEIEAAAVRLVGAGSLIASSSDGEGGSIALADVGLLASGPGTTISTRGEETRGAIFVSDAGGLAGTIDGDLCVGGDCVPETNLGRIVLEREDGSLEQIAPGRDENGDAAHYLITSDLGELDGTNLLFDFRTFGLGTDEGGTVRDETALFSPQGRDDTIHHVVATVSGDAGGPTMSRVFGEIRSTIEGAALWLINEAGWLLGDEAAFDVNGAVHVVAGRGVTFDAEGRGTVDYGTGFAGITMDDGVELEAEDGNSLELAAGGDLRIGTDTEVFAEDDGALRLYSHLGDVRIGFETDAKPDEAGADLGTEKGGSIEIAAREGSVVIGREVLIDSCMDECEIGGELKLVAAERVELDATARLVDPGGSVRVEGGELALGGTIDVSAPAAPGSISIEGGSGALPGRFFALSDDVSTNGTIEIGSDTLDLREASLFGDARIRRGGEFVPLVERGEVVFAGGGAVTAGEDAEGVLVDYLIDASDGALDGHRLWFGFDTFYVGLGESASFTDLYESSTVSHIVAQVRGDDSASRMDGFLRTTIPGAALWLLDPDGWMFGSSARLDLRGGLHVGTSAADAGAVGLARGPLALADARDAEPGSIVVGAGALLQLRDEERIELSADGDIRIGSLATLATRGGTVSLRGSGLTIAGEVAADGVETDEIGPDGDAGRVDIEALDTLRIEGPARISATGGGRGSAGRVALRGDRVVVGSGADVVAEGGAAPGGGDEFDGFGGEIRITAEAVSIERGGVVRVPARENRAGRIALHADEISVAGTLAAKARPDGDGGRILLAGTTVTMADGVIDADGFESGSGGVVSIRADGLDADAPRISASGREGGFVAIAGRELRTGGAVLSLGLRRAGAIRLFGEDRIDLVGADAIVSGGLLAGEANLETSLLLQSEGAITVAGGLASASGLPQLVARGQIDESNARLLVRPSSPGRVAVRAAELKLEQGGRVESTSFGSATGGDLDVRVERLRVLGKGSALRAGTAGAGDGGGIRVIADSIRLGNGGSISTASDDLQDEERTAYRNLLANLFDVAPEIRFAETVATGDGGSIGVAARTLELDSGSEIRAGARSAGSAGNIDVTVQVALAGRGGRIEADATAGAGGHVTVSGNVLAGVEPTAFITAEGPKRSLDGVVVIDDDASDDLNTPIETLSTDPLDPTTQMHRCAEGPAGSFVERLDRLPPAPDGPLLAWPDEDGASAATAGAARPRVGAYLAVAGGCR